MESSAKIGPEEISITQPILVGSGDCAVGSSEIELRRCRLGDGRTRRSRYSILNTTGGDMRSL